MSSYMTIGTWIRDRGRLTPERTAIDFCDRTVTYGELDRDSSRLAAELMGRGLGRGDRVAVLADNCPEYVTLFFACAKAGLVMTPLNWRLAPPELAYQVDHSGASVVLASRSRLEQAEQVVAEAEHRPPIRPLEDPPEAEGDVDVVVEDDDPLFLIYTSGTTAGPREPSSPTPTAFGPTRPSTG